MGEVALGSNISEHGGIAEAHGEGVVGVLGQELLEGLIGQLRPPRAALGGRAVQLLRRMRKRLVEYGQHDFNPRFSSVFRLSSARVVANNGKSILRN